MRWIVACVLSLAVLAASAVAFAAVALFGCDENVYRDTARGDVCGIVDRPVFGGLLILAPPVAVFASLIIGRGAGRWFLAFAALVVVAATYTVLISITSGNLFAELG